MHIELPELYQRQQDAIFNPSRFVFIEGSTKSGKTAGCMTWQLAQVLTRKGIHWWVAPVYAQARIAFERSCKDFEGIYESTTKSPMTIRFPNGSEWHFKSADNADSLYGQECESIVIDEASRTKEDVFDACYSTLSTTRGPMRCIANVTTRSNWHYKMCRRAEQGEPDFHYAMLTAQDAVDGGVLHEDSLKAAERQLPSEVFRALYFCEPADDAFSPFGYDNIKDCTRNQLAPGPAVVFGLDLARKTDFTALVGLNQQGAVCDFYHHRGGNWTQIYDDITRIVKDNTPILFDATGIGDPISEELRKRKLNVTPFVFTSNSKQDLMTTLRIAIIEKRIAFPEGRISQELETFEYITSSTGKVSYSAPTGLHDDCVMALAMAYYMGTVETSRIKPHAINPITLPAVARRERNARKYL